MTFEEVIEATKNVNALLTEQNKKTLYHYANLVPEDGLIIDVGTAQGASAFIMTLAAAPSVKVLTVDPTYPKQDFFTLKRELDLDKRLFYYQGESKDLAIPHPIDMIFIDGVHSYNGVREDYEKYAPYVKQYGIIAFHDCVLYGNTIGAYVKEIVKNKLVETVETDLSEWQDKGPLGLFVGRKI